MKMSFRYTDVTNLECCLCTDAHKKDKHHRFPFHQWNREMDADHLKFHEKPLFPTCYKHTKCVICIAYISVGSPGTSKQPWLIKQHEYVNHRRTERVTLWYPVNFPLHHIIKNEFDRYGGKHNKLNKNRFRNTTERKMTSKQRISTDVYCFLKWNANKSITDVEWTYKFINRIKWMFCM